MRIVGGKWRGRQIEAPDGRDVTRPTTDRTREQIASMILSAAGLDLSGTSVLDAFAGSGAMGLELLSRGAARATFLDRDRRAVARIKRTASSLGAVPGEVSALGGDALRLCERSLPGAPFGVVFLDPPYALDAGEVSRLVGFSPARDSSSAAPSWCTSAPPRRRGLTAPALPWQRPRPAASPR